MTDPYDDWRRQQAWRNQIAWELEEQGETWEDVESLTWTNRPMSGGRSYEKTGSLDEFLDLCDGGYTEPFTLWTAKRIYFPACYDSSQWVASVPRHPCDEATDHVGGG